MTGKIEYRTWITRDDVRRERDKIFLFGDNMMRVGMGGQARHMRGEINSRGVVTKAAPGESHRCYFNDKDPFFRELIEKDLEMVDQILKSGKTVVVATSGLGTGLSELPSRAPGLHNLIVNWFRARSPDCPWM